MEERYLDTEPIDTSVIKIEAEDVVIKDEEYIIDGVESSSECVISDLEPTLSSNEVNNAQSFNSFRPTRLVKTSIVTSEVKNIYAKPRMHFTGKGIVTKTQPGYNFTLKTRKGRKPKMKDRVKEEQIDIATSVPIPDHEIVVDIDSPLQRSKDSESKAESTPESESYFFIKKKRDRKFQKGLQHNRPKNLVHPNYYMDFDETQDPDSRREEPAQEEYQTGSRREEPAQEEYQTELNISDRCSWETQTKTKSDVAYKSFINKKMFKRVGHYSDCLVECTICFKQMKDTSMKQHFKTHSGAKPFPCNFCGARFTRKGDVYRHRKTIHRNVKPFECTMCEKRFAERKSLISHLQNHDRMLYYTCSSCGFKFGKREYYENHIRFIHPLPEGQSLTDVKDIVEKGLKQLEKLLIEEKEEIMEGKKHSSCDIELIKEFEDEFYPDILIKEEREDLGTISDESQMDPLSPGSSVCPEIVAEDVICKDVSSTNDPNDNVSVVKGTLSLTQRVSSQESLEAQEEEELVNKAIYAAVCQAETALESIQSSIGNNMTSKCKNKSFKTTSKINDSTCNKLSKKMQPKSSEIHINATVGGNGRKFIVQIPSGSNIDATTQEGMDALVNMVNYLCSGKGELNGPVEVVMHHSI